MKFSRRSFLSGALVLSVASVAGIHASESPIIYGDGIHDDTAGLQALFSGKPFRVLDGSPFIAREGNLKGGVYLITEKIRVKGDPGSPGYLVEDAKFIWRPKNLDAEADFPFVATISS